MHARAKLKKQPLIDIINSICDERISEFLNKHFCSCVDGEILNIISKFEQLKYQDSYGLNAFIVSLKKRVDENSPRFSQDKLAYSHILEAYSSYSSFHEEYLRALTLGNNKYNRLGIRIKSADPSLLYTNSKERELS